MKALSKDHSRLGLTLVEVLIVTVASALVVMLAIAFRQSAIHRGCSRNNCLGQLRQLGLAMKAYANDDVQNQLFCQNSAVTTSTTYFKRLYAGGYLTNYAITHCPSDKVGSGWQTGQYSRTRPRQK